MKLSFSFIFISFFTDLQFVFCMYEQTVSGGRQKFCFKHYRKYYILISFEKVFNAFVYTLPTALTVRKPKPKRMISCNTSTNSIFFTSSCLLYTSRLVFSWQNCFEVFIIIIIIFLNIVSILSPLNKGILRFPCGFFHLTLWFLTFLDYVEYFYFTTSHFLCLFISICSSQGLLHWVTFCIWLCA